MAFVTLLFSIGFAFLIALFAVQNSAVVNVNLLTWNIEASLVLVILGAASLGFLTALSLQILNQKKEFSLFNEQKNNYSRRQLGYR